MSFGRSVWKLAFELSPIILTNGIAQNLPGGMMPIIALTEVLNTVVDLAGGNPGDTLDSFFAHYAPVSGGTLIEQQVGKYPFANQTVAANAVIAQPLQVSLRMTCPAKGSFGYFTKLATIIGLQAALAKHNASGGTYIVATPSFFYTNCLLLSMRDVTAGETAQSQVVFQLDFYKPLLTASDAAEAQSSLIGKLTNGLQLPDNPTWSGLGSILGDTTSLGGLSSGLGFGNAAGNAIAPPQGPVPR